MSVVEIPEEVQAQPEPVRLQAPGIRMWMGEMRAVMTAMPIKEVVQQTADTVIYREDFKLKSKVPGNRLIRSEWVETIKKGIREYADRLLLGTFIFAIKPDGIIASKPWPNPEKGGNVMDVVIFGLRSGFKLFILDAQHRSKAVQKLWEETIAAVANGDLAAEEVARLLGRSSVPVVIVLESDERQIRRMFVTMASTRPIPTALVVAMDEFRPVNRLGILVAEKSKVLSNGGPAGRLEYQSGTPKADKVYTAASVRTAASVAVIGFNDRTPAQRDQNLEDQLKPFGVTQESRIEKASTWIAGAWNYGAERMPGWKQIVSGEKTPDEVRSEYLIGSGAALLVISGVLAACRFAEIDYKPVLDAVAELPWRRKQTRPAKDPITGADTINHEFFEGLLVISDLVKQPDGTLVEESRTAGGNRTQYQGATRKVLDHLAQEARFQKLTSPEVLRSLGLLTSGKRGRPAKAA